jgi:parvulin-like peptidyl-prolyl isomerase
MKTKQHIIGTFVKSRNLKRHCSTFYETINTIEALPCIFIILAVAASLFTSNDCAWAAQKGSSAKAQSGVKQDAPDNGVKQEKPELVARVNGEPVTRAQFDRMVANPLTLSQAQRELGVEAPDSKELERLAVRKLVHLRLRVQEAGRRKITVTQKELDEAITALRRRFNDLKDFGVWVKQQGLNDPELFETVRTDMLAERVTTALVEGVRVTEEQTQQYFEAHQDDLIIGAEVRLRIIAVSNKAEAQEIVAAMQKGVPFDRLARQRSMGRLAAKGGDTGWVDFRTLPSPLREATVELKPGEVSGPLQQGADEFLIVGLQDRRPVRAKSLVEARPEIERRLLPVKQQEAIEAWLSEQEKKSKIEMFL